MSGRRKECISIKEEYLEKEREFDDAGMYILFVEKQRSGLSSNTLQLLAQKTPQIYNFIQ
jgi:hypothetical protein